MDPSGPLGEKEELNDMEYIGAGLAALGVLGPGIGIGILGGLSATAIGRNPDAAGRYGNVATGSGSDAGKGRPPAAAVTGNPSPTKASSSFRGSTVIFAFPAYNPG